MVACTGDTVEVESRMNARSTMTLPDLTAITTICRSKMPSIDDKPEINKRRRSDPSKNVSIAPLKVMEMGSCSRGWQMTLPDCETNPDGHDLHADSPEASPKKPAAHGKQATAPTFENDDALQSPEGKGRETNEQYFPAGQGMHAEVAAPPAEYDPTTQSPLTAASAAPAQYLPAGQGVHAALVAPPAEYDPA